MYDYDNLALRFNVCFTRFESLFAGLEDNADIQQLKKEIYFYYVDSLNGVWTSDAIETLAQFEEFIDLINAVQEGKLTSEVAINDLKDINDIRISETTAHNIFKFFEMAFWMVAAAVSITACVVIGLPVLVLNPLLGAVITITTLLLGLFSTANFVSSTCAFKTNAEANSQFSRENDLVTFFANPRPVSRASVTEEKIESEEDDLDLSGLYPAI